MTGGRYGELSLEFRAEKKRLIEEALVRAGGNRAHAAAELGINRTYLQKLIRDLGIDIPPAPRQMWQARGWRKGGGPRRPATTDARA